MDRRDTDRNIFISSSSSAETSKKSLITDIVVASEYKFPWPIVCVIAPRNTNSLKVLFRYLSLYSFLRAVLHSVFN